MTVVAILGGGQVMRETERSCEAAQAQTQLCNFFPDLPDHHDRGDGDGDGDGDLHDRNNRDDDGDHHDHCISDGDGDGVMQ